MKTSIHTLILLFFVLIRVVQAQPEMRLEDRVRIKEAIEINNQYGESVWKGISTVPFTVILVTDSIEFLINHPNPSEDFISIGYDTLLQSEVLYREARFQTYFLATFPAVNGVSCIVVGTPENTGKTSTGWIITLLHEHFHQYQTNDPDYYTSVNELELSKGDNTGMWMLNYPFPYANEKVILQYNKYIKALKQTIMSANETEFKDNLTEYVAERRNFAQLLDSTDYKYFSFQVWQEGIARYTEYKYLQLLENYQPQKAVSGLKDFVAFGQYRDQLYTSELKSLSELSLKDNRRICFYAIGFAEGLILDRLNPNWQEDYLTDKFFLEHYSDKFGN